MLDGWIGKALGAHEVMLACVAVGHLEHLKPANGTARVDWLKLLQAGDTEREAAARTCEERRAVVLSAQCHTTHV
jgi:hypothetical protein